MAEEEQVVIKHIEAEILELFLSWGLSCAGISALEECRIASFDVIKILNGHDIENVFQKRELMADRIKFRYGLNKWREANHVDVIPCCQSDKTLSMVSQWLSSDTMHASSSTSSQNVFEFRGKTNTNIDFNIKEILQKTVAGDDMIKAYQQTPNLSSTDQTIISRCIVDHFHHNGLKMCPKTMKSVAKEIVKLFPNEDERTYYVPRENGKQPSGKIFDRYFNVGYNRKRKADLSVTEKIAKSTTDIENDASTISEENDKMEVEEFLKKKEFLLYNSPENAKSLWEETSKMRMKEEKYPISSFLTAWPRYKDTNAEQLINVDFNTLHPGKSNKLFEKFYELEKRANKVFFPSSIKEKLFLEMYKKMVSPELCADSKNFFFFNLLHTILIPPRISKTCKPSISDAQKDMFVHLVSLNNFKHKEDELQLQAISEKLKLQPKIFVIGESLESLKEFYVYLEGIRYKVSTLLDAIDLVVKISFVFNLDYTQKSKYVWFFLQEYIYEIVPDEKISKIKNIISKLENVNIE
ncbi:uncharacterized protein LOC129950904 [Eupeodes corollae]|uniref:uncharacterized protein LOC129950904 n=1 Tax=Eupeodes corollae TaxID=290404 RepID=UPI00249093B7|nr:uncharacterized protein LOC129950904 [Eupeodes corollae]